MSGRRSHVRFAVLQSPQGMLRVLQDVVIQNTRPDHTVALSCEPGVVGELVSVRFPHNASDIRARVLDSQPVVVDGNVRHQLRLLHQNDASVGEPNGDVMDGSVVDGGISDGGVINGGVINGGTVTQ